MKILLLAALAIALPLSAAAADDDSPCQPRQKMAEHLAEKYGEQPVARGLTKQGLMVEIFASADGSTWSLVMTRPGRPSCLMSAGTDWQALVAVFGVPS